MMKFNVGLYHTGGTVEYEKKNPFELHIEIEEVFQRQLTEMQIFQSIHFFS